MQLALVCLRAFSRRVLSTAGRRLALAVVVRESYPLDVLTQVAAGGSWNALLLMSQLLAVVPPTVVKDRIGNVVALKSVKASHWQVFTRAGETVNQPTVSPLQARTARGVTRVR